VHVTHRNIFQFVSFSVLGHGGDQVDGGGRGALDEHRLSCEEKKNQYGPGTCRVGSNQIAAETRRTNIIVDTQRRASNVFRELEEAFAFVPKYFERIREENKFKNFSFQ
jgi:hypothetical protein